MDGQRELPLGGRQEPKLGKTAEAAAVRSEITGSQSNKLDALCVEVFRLTGQKITTDDPVLLAALFQSELIGRASAHSAEILQEAVAQSIAQLTEVVNGEREQAAILQRSVAIAFQQIADGAKKTGDQELLTMQSRFARAASETLDLVRRESAGLSPASRAWRTGIVLCGGIIAGLVGGVTLDKVMTPRLTDDQLRLMHNGILLDDAWPRLPKSGRELFGLAPKPAESRQVKSSPGTERK